MKIKDVMGSYVEAAEPGMSLVQAAQIMSDADVGSIPVVDDGRIRRVVVLNESGKVYGVVSLGDLSNAGGPAEVAAPREAATSGTEVDGMIDDLVRDELAAIETYKQALQKVGNADGSVELRRIESEHEEAARLLQGRSR